MLSKCYQIPKIFLLIYSCEINVQLWKYICWKTEAKKGRYSANEITQLIQNFTATSTDGTLVVSETLWKSHIDLSQCSSFINSSNGHSMSFQLSRTKIRSLYKQTQIIITPRCIHSIGIYEIKQQGDYILIQVVQEEFGHERDLLQLQNGLKLKNSKPQPDLVTIFKTPLRHYSKNVSDDAVARLLKAHLVQTVTTIKQFSDSRMGKNLFYSMRDWNVTILDHLNISFHRR